jgi:hypothetical protein
MPKKSWKERVEATECAWKEAFQTLLEEVFATQAFNFLPCKKCGLQLTAYVVRCSSCNMFYCGKCDLEHHESQPFHNRTLDTLTSSTCLLSHQFADENGELFSKGWSESLFVLYKITKIISFRCSSSMFSSRIKHQL